MNPALLRKAAATKVSSALAANHTTHYPEEGVVKNILSPPLPPLSAQESGSGGADRLGLGFGRVGGLPATLSKNGVCVGGKREKLTFSPFFSTGNF